LLYVEDEPEIRELLRDVLVRKYPKLDIYTAENGLAGLELFREHRPDIVLTDIRMPVMDGIQMSRGIREEDSAASIIIISACSETDYLLEAIKMGISRYVLKPINHKMLIEAINDCAARIIHERQVKAQNELIRRLNDELEQRVADRTVELEASNRELQAFCYSVAHDLSTPLRGINGYSNILLEEYSDKLDEAGKGYLVRMGAAAERMGQLINDLLELSRVTRRELHREKIDLSLLVNGIAKNLRQKDPDRKTEFIITPKLQDEGDPILVRLALENLLGNAWKYTARVPCPRIEFGTCISKGETVYFVRDNGIGFDMAYVHKLFIPFQKLHGINEYGGTGVGLASVQRIIARHGGKIWAEGEPGHGATFYFTVKSPGLNTLSGH
ncbi:MAG: response regulator, partial [Deltaproteobacteria bacterium]|nr:response regulator [Deltaproteobacteria bacterium]